MLPDDLQVFSEMLRCHAEQLRVQRQVGDPMVKQDDRAGQTGSSRVERSAVGCPFRACSWKPFGLYRSRCDQQFIIAIVVIKLLSPQLVCRQALEERVGRKDIAIA